MNEWGIFVCCRINELIAIYFLFYTLTSRKLEPDKKYFLYPLISGVIISLGLMIYVFTHIREQLKSWNQEELLGEIFIKNYKSFLIPMIEGIIAGLLILYLTRKKINEKKIANS